MNSSKNSCAKRSMNATRNIRTLHKNTMSSKSNLLPKPLQKSRIRGATRVPCTKRNLSLPNKTRTKSSQGLAVVAHNHAQTQCLAEETKPATTTTLHQMLPRARPPTDCKCHQKGTSALRTPSATGNQNSPPTPRKSIQLHCRSTEITPSQCMYSTCLHSYMALLQQTFTSCISQLCKMQHSQKPPISPWPGP